VGKTYQLLLQVKINIKNTFFLGETSWNQLNQNWTDYMSLGKLMKGMTLFMVGELEYMFGSLDVKGLHVGNEFLVVKLHGKPCCDGLHVDNVLNLEIFGLVKNMFGSFPISFNCLQGVISH
jgi:hypothetical protein